MPLYEYLCLNCRRRFTIYVKAFSPPSSPSCPRCNASNSRRLFSTFFRALSETEKRKDIYEDVLSDSRLVEGLLRNDPRALAEWNRRLTRGMDAEISPEYEEMLERMEHGEWPRELLERPEEQEGGKEEGGE